MEFGTYEIASGVVVKEADVEIENSEATVDELIRTDELASSGSIITSACND